MIKKKRSKSSSIVMIAVIAVIGIIILFVAGYFVDENLFGQAGEENIDYGYEITFNWLTGQITGAREYTQPKSITRSTSQYLKKYLALEPTERKPYTATVELNKKSYPQPFQPSMVDIAEQFNDDGTISNPTVTIVDLAEVSVRFALPRKLDDQTFKFLVKNPAGKRLATAQYQVARTGNEFFIEHTAVEQSDVIGRRTKIVHGSDEGNVVHEEDNPPLWLCPDLREVYPGHNVLGENRYNLIFIGVGYDRDEFGRPEFVDQLPLILNYNELIDVDLRVNRVSDFKHEQIGLFGPDPFRNNQHLFNFWYTNNIYPLADYIPEDSGISEDLCQHRLSESYDDCDILSNLKEIYLVNEFCTSQAQSSPWLSGNNDRVVIAGRNLANDRMELYHDDRLVLESVIDYSLKH